MNKHHEFICVDETSALIVLIDKCEFSEILYKSISTLFPFSVYNERLKKICFNSFSIQRLDMIKTFSYSLIVKLISCLSKQICFLETNGYSFTAFDLQNIYYINDSYFFVCDSRYIKKIDENNVVWFYEPIILTFTTYYKIPTEKVLPFSQSYKAVYYNFGMLILNCLGLGNINEVIDEKMYWFLHRCMMTDDDEKKSLLFV